MQSSAHEHCSFGQVVLTHAGAAARDRQLTSPHSQACPQAFSAVQKCCITTKALFGRICYFS